MKMAKVDSLTFFGINFFLLPVSMMDALAFIAAIITVGCGLPVLLCTTDTRYGAAAFHPADTHAPLILLGR